MRVSLRTSALIVVLVASITGVVSVMARPTGTAQAKPAAVCILPDEITWHANPGVHGLQTATLFGDASVAKPYAERIKFPANYRLPPHSHPNDARMVTVLAGTLYFAFGDKFDETKLKALPTGTFFIEPKDTPHFALTKGEVILQLNAIGPAGTKYVKSPSESQH